MYLNVLGLYKLKINEQINDIFFTYKQKTLYFSPFKYLILVNN